MANLITITKQLDGSKLFTTKVDIVGDGSGDEGGLPIIVPGGREVKIRAIQWALNGFSADLIWKGAPNSHAYALPVGSDGIRFSDTGAHLVNNAVGKTGDVTLVTTGLDSGLSGSIIIEGQYA